ncbi:unnamed protein product [Absidia cylindrospora]
MDLDKSFPDYMNFMDFIHQQKAKHDPNTAIRWLHYKKWLLDYTDTPRQKIKDINAILSIVPHETESTSEFTARLQKQISKLYLENLSAQELINGTILHKLPYNWKKEAFVPIFASKDNLLKSKMNDFCEMIKDLDVDAAPAPSTNKRKFDVSEEMSKSKHAHAFTSNKKPFGGSKLCSNNCGKAYVPGHNLVCTNRRVPNHVKTNRSLKFAHLSDRTVDCLDPRHINKYLKDDKFPLPKIQDIFLKLKGANIFTTLDLTQAFHRFPIHPLISI